MRLVYKTNAKEIFKTNPSVFTEYVISEWEDLFNLASILMMQVRLNQPSLNYNMKLITRYKLELKEVNSTIHNNKEYEILAQFLDYWNCINDIEEDLLPEVDSVINGALNCSSVGADVVGLAYVEIETTKLLGSDVGYSDFALATNDFKVLILEWIKIIKEFKMNSISGLTTYYEEE